MTDLEKSVAREVSLLKLGLDYRAALAHTPLDPKDVHAVLAAWSEEALLVQDGLTISYGFVLRYRGRFVYLWGSRYPDRERYDHAFQWFDEEPSWLYERTRTWLFDVDEVLTNGTFLSDKEAGRPAPAD